MRSTKSEIWGVARTQAEIVGAINQELAAGTNLVARWGANEGIGTAIASSVGTFPGTLTNGPTSISGAPFNLASPAQYSLTVNTVGNGTVTPPSGTYYEGLLQLTTIPDSGYAFSGWSGDLGGTTNPAMITMDGNKTVTANFIVSSCTEVTLTAAEDNWLRASQATTNFGGATTLSMNPNGTSSQFALLKWDLAASLPMQRSIVPASHFM